MIYVYVKHSSIERESSRKKLIEVIKKNKNKNKTKKKRRLGTWDYNRQQQKNICVYLIRVVLKIIEKDQIDNLHWYKLMMALA